MTYEWCKELPVKVIEGRAAWLSRTRGAILLRPRGYASKTVQFILTFKGSFRCSDTEQAAHCYVVPSFQQVQLLLVQRH